MKRLVYVPFSQLEDGEIPKVALDLAKETQLPIRIGEEENTESEIHIAQIPEKNQIDYKKTIKVNFVQPLDYTNEFIVLPSDLVCKVSKSNTYGTVSEYYLTPVLKESHVVKYRDRFPEAGVYDFVISTFSHGILHEGKFEVI
jgi:hypothetical protein